MKTPIHKKKGGGDHIMDGCLTIFFLVVFVPFSLPIIQNIISNSSNKTLFFLGVCVCVEMIGDYNNLLSCC